MRTLSEGRGVVVSLVAEVVVWEAGKVVLSLDTIIWSCAYTCMN